MLRIFIGYDERQPVSYSVLNTSIILQSTEPVAVTPLRISQLPLTRTGLTPFTFSRFLVPYLCNYEGWALFLDIDMVLNGDIAELFKCKNDKYAVMVSKNEHRFEWASAILYNCGHEANSVLIPEYVEKADGLHGINWCDESLVGAFPGEWNHLVGYDAAKPAKLIHFTQGVPAYPETETSEYADLWREWATIMNSTLPWDNLMGQSVHSAEVNGVRMPKFLWDLEKQEPKPEHLEKVKELLKV